MTICVSVRVGEGLVLAADSMVTLTGTMGAQQGIVQTFEFANKLTQLKDYPVGVMTWGAAAMGSRSIQSLIMEYEYGLPLVEANAGFEVRTLAQGLIDFLRPLYDAAFPAGGNRPELGIYVGGFSAGNFFSDAFTFTFPASVDLTIVRPLQLGGQQSFGADWYGQPGPMMRLVKGYDAAALSELVNRGAPLNVVQQWVADNVGEVPLIFDGMPIQDAIDFAKFATAVTIGWFRFGIGAPLCGGPVDIAVITPTKVRWAERKQWSIRGDAKNERPQV